MSTLKEKNSNIKNAIKKFSSRIDRWGMFHKLTEKGINIPFSYIMECSEIEWLEVCVVYNDIYQTFDKKELNELIEEVENAR